MESGLGSVPTDETIRTVETATLLTFLSVYTRRERILEEAHPPSEVQVRSGGTPWTAVTFVYDLGTLSCFNLTPYNIQGREKYIPKSITQFFFFALAQRPHYAFAPGKMHQISGELKVPLE